MQTHCTPKVLGFQALGSRKVVAGFGGGMISSDAGGLLLREVALKTGLLRQFAACFKDYRDQRFVEHSVEDLVSQKVVALCLGYEDVVDHDTLRFDPLFAALCGKVDPSGMSRVHARDKGKACAGKSTLNRVESWQGEWYIDRTKKIATDDKLVEEFFVNAFLNSHPEEPKSIVLDLDATDNELHGKQEGRFFNGHYDCYCYLPLYTYCGDDLLSVKLRTADVDPAQGVAEELDRIIGKIRERWADVQVIIRADSGFCRESIMRWCEDHGVFYILGLSRNVRLVKRIKKQLRRSCVEYAQTRRPARRYLGFFYRTRKSWSRSRRVIAKAEYTEGKENPRFIVCHLPRQVQYSAQGLYEELYCARGEMENRIKEQQLYLFADRSSCMKMKGNQLRLWFSAVAYVLMNELKRRGLQGTALAQATSQTIRLKLFKIGGLVRVSVRRIAVSLSSGYPYQELFMAAYRALRASRPLRC